MFEVTAEDITRLSGERLAALLDRLLHVEVLAYKIPLSSVRVSLKMHTADGGDDGRIEWEGGPDRTNYLPRRNVLFQCKATYRSKEMTPANCAEEIGPSAAKRSSSHGAAASGRKKGSPLKRRVMKSGVEAALDQGATYILFCTEEFSPAEIERRTAAIREAIRACGKRYYDTVDIQIYDAKRIANWTNRYLAAITDVYAWCGKNILLGMHTWDDWSGYFAFYRFNYVPSPKRAAIIQTLQKQFQMPQHAARVVGLSGLGKTRLALEIFRPSIDVEMLQHNALSKSVIYVDAMKVENLLSHVISWRQNKLEGILIVDNCSSLLHEQLEGEIRHMGCRLKLLTLNYEPSKQTATSIKLEADSDEVIRQMLLQAYPEMPLKDLERIAKFAQGFPQMAVLMVDAYLRDEANLAELRDEDLLRRLMWGREPVDTIGQSVIKLCAIFEEIGWKGSVGKQYKFLAEFADTLERNVYYWLTMFSRTILQAHGDYLQVAPKPLALRLAADWLHYTMPEIVLKLIDSLPEEMRASFAAQFARLDFLPEAKNIVAMLCQEDQLLAKLELLRTQEGAQILNSAAEINPEAVSNSISEMFKGLSVMPDYVKPGVLNLIYALEKLCFRQNTFREGAQLLLRLRTLLSDSVDQQLVEKYFLRLFQIYGAGTQTPLEERSDFLVNLSRGELLAQERVLLTKACERGLQTTKQPRSPRAEFQGSGKVLQMNAPS